MGGLYRDDALFTVIGHSNVEIERITKRIRKFFKQFVEFGSKVIEWQRYMNLEE